MLVLGNGIIVDDEKKENTLLESDIEKQITTEGAPSQVKAVIGKKVPKSILDKILEILK